MKKIKLNIDDLKISSFETGSGLKSQKGTVEGNTVSFGEETCFGPSCRHCPTENPTICTTCEGVCPD